MYPFSEKIRCSTYTTIVYVQGCIPVNLKINQGPGDREELKITSLLNNGHVKANKINFVFF